MPGASDYLYLTVVISFIIIVAIVVVYASVNITPLLNKIGYTEANVDGNIVYTPIAGITPYNQSYCSPEINTSNNCWESPSNATQGILNNYKNFDQYIPFLYFLVAIAILGSVLFLPNNGVTISITFIVMIVTILTSTIFSNSLKPFFTDPLFTNVVTFFPNSIALIANIGYYNLLFFFIYIILIAARSRYGGSSPPSGGTNLATIGST